jgi:hypothetical protein
MTDVPVDWIELSRTDTMSTAQEEARLALLSHGIVAEELSAICCDWTSVLTVTERLISGCGYRVRFSPHDGISASRIFPAHEPPMGLGNTLNS